MGDVPIHEFHSAIQVAHGTASTLIARERVVAAFERGSDWEGEVLVFVLEDHPTASRCYAWQRGGEVTMVLEEGPVKSARDAVRAAVVAAASG